ncbi:hypothetical protein Tco_0527213 [Tanacetum coccineum]
MIHISSLSKSTWTTSSSDQLVETFVMIFKKSRTTSLNFFLGLQIKQLEDDIFFNQSKYIKEMLKKFGLEDSKPIKTPMSSKTKLTRDEDEESVDDTKYHGMIGSLLYLKASRPNIMFSGTTHLGLWYPKGTRVETSVYADSDHAGDYVDRKSTSGFASHRGSPRSKPP